MNQFKLSIAAIVLLLTGLFQIAYGQNVKSYGCIGSVDAYGNKTTPTGMVSLIATFDGNVLDIGTGRNFVMIRVNTEGSKVYKNTVPANSFNPVFVVVSSDASTLKEVFQHQMMGVNISYSTFYQYIGEGKEPAYRMTEMERGIQQGRDPFQEYRDYKRSLR